MIIVKTHEFLEKITATYILEKYPEAKVRPRPYGATGIVIVENVPPEERENILKEIPEVEKAIPVYAKVEADLEKIAEAAAEVAKRFIKPEDTFAVRCVRRGKHNFTSIDVAVKAGERIQEVTQASVDLTNPKRVVRIEIFHDEAYIGISPEQKRGYKRGKPSVVSILRKISVIQLPYLGSGAREMGIRIGRAAQTFEIGELIIAPMYYADGEEFCEFLRGVLRGRRTRLQVQKRTYHRDVHEVPVKVFDLYRALRDRMNEPIIVTSAKGKPIDEVAPTIAEILKKYDRVNVFIGSREGIPTGIYRFASVVVDFFPGVTFSTEFGIPAAVTALVHAYLEHA